MGRSAGEGESSPPDRRRVVVLAGPSGSGKSRLAARLQAHHAWPIVRLDDFYRDGDDATLPRLPDLGIVDWDDPASWDGDRAVEALCTLVESGACTTPVYDLSSSRAVGRAEVSAAPGDRIIAEGIFAAEIIPALRERGVLHSAWCIHHPAPVTFVRRLARDLSERRKPPMVLLRRGWTLMRDEPDVVRRQVALGATAARPDSDERCVTGPPAG